MKTAFNDYFIRNVIRAKDSITAAAGAYSCTVYIKASQEDSMSVKNPKKPMTDSMREAYELRMGMERMAMAEVLIRLDKSENGRI